MTCTYRSGYTDSGDRGADMADHERHAHPDHEHVWGDSPYDWEQVGELHIAPGARTEVTPRPATAQRCTVCKIEPSRVVQCPPPTRWSGARHDTVQRIS